MLGGHQQGYKCVHLNTLEVLEIRHCSRVFLIEQTNLTLLKAVSHTTESKLM